MDSRFKIYVKTAPSARCQKDHFMQEGKQYRKEITLEYWSEDIPEDERRLCWKYMDSNHTITMPALDTIPKNFSYIHLLLKQRELNELKEYNDLVQNYDERIKRINSKLDNTEEYEVTCLLQDLKSALKNSKYQDEQAQPLLERAEKLVGDMQKLKQQKAQQEKLEKQQQEQEENEWIEAYGSQHLKLLKANNYKWRKTYTKEFLRRKYPKYFIDFSDNVGSQSLDTPKQETLEFLSKYPDTEIVLVYACGDQRYKGEMLMFTEMNIDIFINPYL